MNDDKNSKGLSKFFIGLGLFIFSGSTVLFLSFRIQQQHPRIIQKSRQSPRPNKKPPIINNQFLR